MGTYHIRETDSGWELIKYGASRPSKRASSKLAILDETQQFLQSKVASLVVHHEDGSLQHLSYPANDPSLD